MNNNEITYGGNYTIFGTSNNSVNAETLHKNMLNSSYIGPNNPKTYGNGKPESIQDSYQYKPTWSPTEMAAYNHDLGYDGAGIKGIWGTLNPGAYCINMQLTADCYRVLKDPNSSSVEKTRARKIIAAFSLIDFFVPQP